MRELAELARAGTAMLADGGIETRTTPQHFAS
jgi:hypothetical protein